MSQDILWIVIATLVILDCYLLFTCYYYRSIIKNHYNQSNGHNICWQNNLVLWFNTGLIKNKEFNEKYWPPVCEMYEECRKFIKCNHPEYNGELEKK